jgi:hypothetical protein
MKVGIHEFDAEGPADEVNARFEAWRALIQPSGSAAPPPRQPVGFEPVAPPGEFLEELKVRSPYSTRVFGVDDRRDLVTLRVHPIGDNIEADAVLALVYGYLEMRDVDEVPVTKLTQSMRMSGLRTDRIDRAAGPHTRNGLLIKNGTAKGGRYMLTNPGRQRAELLVKELHDRVA